MTQLIPNGKQQFVDQNGKPLVAGKVFFYSVGTNTPKNTYQDIGETILNTNPVILDARGQAGIYGTGPYRQVLRDRFDNLIWDQVIPDPSKVNSDALAQFIANLADPVDPTHGTALVGRSVMAVDSISALLLCPRRTDLRYSVKGYVAGTDFGGGPNFYWSATSTEAENLVDIFAVPGVPTGRFYRGNTGGSVLVDDAGAQPGALTSQRTAIERADAVAQARGAALVFRGGVNYYADELFLKSTVILGNNTRIIKTAATSQGFLNWGNKPTGISDGFISGFELHGNGQANVVNLRMYGNHTRPRVRNMNLIDSDFYAFGIGALTSPGDKLDVINGLDIDGLYIASERGNVSLGTAYSFGLEFFPGVTCSNWRIRNFNSYGRIINKIHSVQNLDIDSINCQLSTVVDPLSSGFFEINNCADVVVGSDCWFDTGNNPTYFCLKIGGSRVPGGLDINRFIMGGQVNGRMAIETVVNIQMVSSFRCYGIIGMYNANGRIGFSGCRVSALRSEPGSTGSIAKLDINATVFEGSLRLEQTGIPVTELIVTGGEFNLSIDQIRLNTVSYALFNGVSILLRGSSPLPYAFSATATAVTLHNVYFDGFTTWDRPILIGAGGQMRLMKCVLDRMVSSTILASGSAALTLSIGNIVNGVAVP